MNVRQMRTIRGLLILAGLVTSNAVLLYGKAKSTVLYIFQLVSLPFARAAQRLLKGLQAAANFRYGPFNFTTRRGSILIGAVISLGVLVIVIPLIYLISVTVGNSLPSSSLSGAQASTLTTLVGTGGSALQLTSVSEIVVGAGIIILGIYLFMRFR